MTLVQLADAVGHSSTRKAGADRHATSEASET